MKLMLNNLMIWGMLCLLLVGSVSILFAQNSNAYYRSLKGFIHGKYPITGNLVVSGENATLYYQYTKVGHPISVGQYRPFLKDSIYAVEEYPLGETRTASGKIKANLFSTDALSGTWMNPAGTRKFSFSLKDHSEAGISPLRIVHYKDSAGYCKEGEEHCLRIDITCPAVDPKRDPTFASVLNPTIEQFLKANIGGLFYGGETGTEAQGVAEHIKKMKAEYLKMLEEEGKARYLTRWAEEFDVSVICNQNHVLSLGISHYTFSGGAHGNFFNQYFNFDTKANKEIELPDIFIGEYYMALKYAVLAKLRSTHELAPNAPLSEAGFHVSEAELELPNNFSLSPSGITFHYMPYEIGPYVMGITEAHIPFKEIGAIIKSGSILDGFAKR